MAVPDSSTFRVTGFLIAIAGFILLLTLANLDPENPDVTAMAAVAWLMAALWICEAIPLAATALIPLVAFPLLGIASTKVTATTYINSTIFLFIGGFLIAIAMQRWNLHRRIALTIIGWFGGRPGGMVFGFMVATAFLSMWISNTATTVMMVPIGLAIIYQLEDEWGADRTRTFSISLMIGIAYAASIGGMATLVGTPPNLAFSRIFQISFPALPEITFGQWFMLGLPLTVVLLVLAWLVVTRVAFRPGSAVQVPEDVVRSEKQGLGRMSREEIAVAIVFAATALLWVFRKDLVIGVATVPGWSRLLADPGLVDDGTVAIGMASLLFLIPGQHGKEKTRLLDAGAFSKLPWSIIILFGGGFALAKGFTLSGLSEYLGAQVADLEDVSTVTLIAAVTGGMMALTELTSNTATTEMLLPVLASVAGGLKLDPLYLMVSATLAASCAFMLPVATPPNAIVFGSGRLHVIDMVKAGLWMNLVAWLVISAAVYLFMPLVFPDTGLLRAQ